MFDPKKLFRRKAEASGLTSLHLDAPSAPRASRPAEEEATSIAPQPVAGVEEILGRSPAQEEIDRRVKDLLASGLVPKETYFLVLENGAVVALPQERPGSFALLLFSSVLVARDYQRATKLNARIAGLRLDDLPAMSPAWKNAGVDCFVMNKCPRCGVYVALKAEGPLTAPQLGFGWAVDRAVRTWRARQLAGRFLSQREMAERRATLELLRDHVDCETPYVHWLIGLLAGVQGDEPARLEATERLAEFGPQFAGKTDVCLGEDDLERWGQSMSEAMLRFSLHYKAIQLPQTTMVQ